MMAHVQEDSTEMLSALPISDSELECGNPGEGCRRNQSEFMVEDGVIRDMNQNDTRECQLSLED